MNASASQKIKIGLFVVAGIVVLIAGVFLIGSKKNMFSKTYTVYGTFRNTGGLQEGNMIRFGGVNVGTVERIRILTDTVVRVDMLIQSDKREFIKNDVVASVGSDGLMGDKLLSIAPGSPTAPLLEAGGQIRTAEPVDFGSIIAKFTTVAENAEVITGALAGMALQIKNGNGSISRLLYRNDLAVGLEGTMNNARSITSSLNDIGAHIQSGQGSLGSLIYTDSLSKGLEHTVSTANFALATVQKAANEFGENMKALQGNYFLRGYFKKKAKGVNDVVNDAIKENAAEEQSDMTEAELEQMRDEADKELKRRREKSAVPVTQTGQGIK
jgi:phospholipid/cholesterol/gamma-HCH transport system substrate-binding protein